MSRKKVVKAEDDQKTHDQELKAVQDLLDFVLQQTERFRFNGGGVALGMSAGREIRVEHFAESPLGAVTMFVPPRKGRVVIQFVLATRKVTDSTSTGGHIQFAHPFGSTSDLRAAKSLLTMVRKVRKWERGE